MSAPILIFGIGNASRGDDALGVQLLRRLEQALHGNPCVAVIETFQLQPEHALDMTGREIVIFADAGHATPAPYHFSRVGAARETTPFSHALTPEALLEIYQRVVGEPPPAWVMCIRGESFELGEDLGPAAARHLELALARLKEFVADASARHPHFIKELA